MMPDITVHVRPGDAEGVTVKDLTARHGSPLVTVDLCPTLGILGEPYVVMDVLRTALDRLEEALS
jgi:hypothetical protein